jgi:hypothetical protein
MQEDMDVKYRQGYDIINRSFSGDHSTDKSKFDSILVSSAGNSAERLSTDVRDESVIGVGSVTLATNGFVYRDNSSWDEFGLPYEQSIEVLGFTNLITPFGMYGGSSCSAPFITGLLALMASDYKSRGIPFKLSNAREELRKLCSRDILQPNYAISHDQITGEKTVIGRDSIPETDVRKIGFGYATVNGYTSKQVVVDNNEIIMTIGDNKITVFGKERVIPVAPVIIDGVTMLPVRIIAESLGLSVKWDALKKIVTLTKR